MGFPPVPEEIAGLTGPPPGAPPSIQMGGPPPDAGLPPGPGGPPPDLMGPPPGPGGGLPPELMAALGGGPGGPPPEEEETEETPSDILADIRDRIQDYLRVETDDIDLQVGTKLADMVQTLFAKNQKEQEAAKGTTPAMKGMAKTLMGR